MAFFLRILLVLIPILALFLWLRWRMKRDLDEATREVEFRRLWTGALVLVVAMLLTGLGLRFFDDASGDTDLVYVPARVEDGKVIPGHYVPKEEAGGEKPESGAEPPVGESGGGDGAPAR